MAGPWQSTPDPDRDTANCDRCGKPVVLDHDPPCPHGYVACPECGHHTVCRDCYTEAQADMFATGVYNPDVDPLFDAEAHAGRRTDWTLEGFDPATNQYRRKP